MKKKVYTKKSEKVNDFLIGFFFVPASLLIVSTCITLGTYYMGMRVESWPLVLFIGMIAAIYISLKRKYIGIGLLFLIILPLLLWGTCLLIFRGNI